MSLETIVHYEEIKKWSQTFIGLDLRMPRLAQSLSRKLRSLGQPVFVRNGYDESMTPGDITLSASYYDEEDAGEGVMSKCIEIVLVSHPSARERITLTEDNMRYFAVSVIECLVHEKRHRYQFEKRQFMHERAFESQELDPEKRGSQEYLGMKMEIDAFAVNIAARLWILFGKQAGEILALGKKVEYDHSPDLYSYYQAFPEGHPVMQSLLRKIHGHLRKLDK